jgi:hypothetical protein
VEISQVTDALSTCLFGLLGIWAAMVRRHWFLRLAVVSAFLLSALLVPAYEIVIEFGLQMAIIAAVLRLYRHGLRWKTRFSLESALLLTVLVAVLTAIGANLPELTWFRWLQLVFVGVLTAYASLLCLWIACGRTFWPWRALVGMSGIASLPVLLHLGHATQGAFEFGRLPSSWETFKSYYQPEYLPRWASELLPTIALCVGLMLTVLWLSKASGWFSTSHEATAPTTRMRLARLAISALFLAIATPLIVILIVMLRPEPIPPVELPNPNGFEYLIAAGKMAPNGLITWLRGCRSMTQVQFKRVYDELGPIAQRIDRGLSKSCKVANPYRYADQAYLEKVETLLNASSCLTIRNAYLDRFGSAPEVIEAAIRDLKFSQESTRGGGVTRTDVYSEHSDLQWIDRQMGKLNADQCRSLARSLEHLHATRESFDERVAVQGIIDQHGHWETHIRWLLAQWSGLDPYAEDRETDLYDLTLLRLTIIEAALQAFALEKGNPPESLDPLCPGYLTNLPSDPFADAPFHYLRTGNTAIAYSIGPDRVDNAGAERDAEGSGDMVAKVPRERPFLTQIKQRLSMWLPLLQDALTKASNSVQNQQKP